MILDRDPYMVWRYATGQKFEITHTKLILIAHNHKRSAVPSDPLFTNPLTAQPTVEWDSK